MINKYKSPIYSLIFIAHFLIFTGCSVRMVADQDPAIIENAIEIFKEIDQFYFRLSSMPENEREYNKFSDDYARIETDLRVLVLQNAARPLNEETTKIAKNILTAWQEFKKMHSSSNTYKDVLIIEDQDSFMQLFADLLTAESVKPISNK